MTPTDRDPDNVTETMLGSLHEGPRATRRPGEATFTVLVALASLILFWSAYGISGFEALSSPGAIPMATTAAMLVTAVMVMLRTLRTPPAPGQVLRRDVLPGAIVVMALLLIAYAVLLKPLGFLPTSALFLAASIKFLSGRGWIFTIAVSVISLIGIYFIFRIIFTVLMPPGIVPEGEMIQFFRDLFAGGA